MPHATIQQFRMQKPKRTIYPVKELKNLDSREKMLAYKPLRWGIPKYEGADVPSKSNIDCEAKEGAGDWKTNDFSGRREPNKKIFTNQIGAIFDPAEIKSGIGRLLRLPKGTDEKPKVAVFAGYVGKFSRALSQAGYDVLHTDPLPEYANQEGLRCMAAYAHELPFSPNTQAYVSYEGFPALTGPHGFLFMLKAIAHTRSGLIVASSIIDVESLAAVLHFRRAYGLGFETLKTEKLYWIHLFADEKRKQKVTLDVNVYQRAMQRGREGMANFSGMHCLYLMGMTTKQIDRIQERLHQAWGSGITYGQQHTICISSKEQLEAVRDFM